MSNPVLQKLTIAHLRGSVEVFELPFERGRKLTVIYGENGTGKSTICDALELLSKGHIASLDNRGLGTTKQYWSTVGKKPTDIAVTLETSSGSCRASFGKNDVVVFPPEAQPRVEVLRRSQILNLVEARPADRYAAIRRFIDVSSIEDAENTLRKLITDLNRNRDVAAARILENMQAIQQFWQSAGQPGTNAVEWARKQTARVATTSDPELVALQALRAAYHRLLAYPEQCDAHEVAVARARAAQLDSERKANAFLQTVAQDAQDIVAVLESARAYLVKHPQADVCPLCQSTEAASGLVERIGMRLEALAVVQSVRQSQATVERNVQQASQQLANLQSQAAGDITAFTDALAAFAWSPDVPLPAGALPATIEQLDDWLAATSELSAGWRQVEAERLDRRQFFSTLRSALHTLDENLEGQAELDALLPKLKQALDIVEEERKTFTDNVLSKIAHEVGRIYEAVHPGEGLHKIKLELHASRRASMDIGTTFGGKSGLPPQAYFSQSHLDTLGLCVFLALAALEQPHNTILILDDVLASVDEPHVDRVISMLHDEATKFRHCIVTTHYGPWRHKLRWGWLKNNQCQFVELSRWSNTQGISLIRSVPEVERLRGLLAEPIPDPQTICSKAGVILEAALDFLTQLYECSVPRKAEPRYTLGELLPAVKGKLRQHLRVDVQNGLDESGKPSYSTVHLAPLLDELQRIAQARNVIGCHFNALSFDLLDTDALLFGQKVLELIEALADPAAGWPRSDKSGSYWSNAGETRRLHPLKQPA